MPRAHAQSRGEQFDSAIFESALANQPQSPRDCVRCSHPRRGSRRGLGTAAQTGPKSRFRRGRSRCIVADIFFFGGRSRANRTAIDTAAPHADEEFAVKARIARQPRSRTNLPVESHVTIPSYAFQALRMDVFGPCSRRVSSLLPQSGNARPTAASANVQPSGHY